MRPGRTPPTPRVTLVLRRCAVVAALVAGGGPAPLPAQDPGGEGAPAAEAHGLRLRGFLGAGALDGPAADLWRADRPWGVEVASSFHGGWLALEAERIRFLAREPGLPPVGGTGLAVGWSRRLRLPLGLGAELGGFLGGLWFEDDEGRMGEPEAEMAVGGHAGLSGPGIGPLRPFVRLRARRIFFRRPLDLVTAVAGLEWSPGLPDALSSALAGKGAAPERGREPGPGGTTALEGEPGAVGDAGSPGAGARTGSTRTLTRRELDRAGATRMEDLLGLLPGWSVASVDRYAWRVLPPGGALLADAPPGVLVDGIPVPISVLGVASLERLPISLADVDSVGVVEGPLLEAGEWVPGGLLRIHTRCGRGWQAGASHQEGNPARDPGLLGLTEPSGGNVDRIGRYTAYGVGYGRGERGKGATACGWAGHANLTRYPTDAAERLRTDRAREAVGGKPYIHTRRLGVGGAVAGPAGRIRVLAGGTRSDDFLFLPAIGTELLTGNDQDVAGLAGRVELPGGHALRYRGAWSRRALERHAFDPRPGPGFRERRVGGTLEWEAGAGRLGLHYDRRRLEGPRGPPREPEIGRARLFAHLPLPGGAGLDVSGSRVGDEWGGAAVAGRTWPVGRRARLTARAAVASVPAAASDGLLAWWRRGYRIPARPALVLGPGGSPGARRSLAGEVRAVAPVGQGAARVEGGVRIRREAGVALLAPRFPVVEGLPVGPDTVPVLTGERGAWAGAWARARGRLAGGWSWGMTASGDAVLSGSDGFRRARSEVPTLRGSAWLLWSALPDLTARASVRARGPARWAPYDVAGSEEDGRVPGRASLDLAVQKWAWGGRLRGLVVVRDLLDQDRPLHPLGVTPGLRMFVRGEVRLGRR